MNWKFIMKYCLYFFLLSFVLSSCNNRAIMLKTERKFKYTDINKLKDQTEYKIGVNDIIELSVATNNGAEIFSNSIATFSGEQLKPFVIPVEFDGSIKIPIIGRINVSGLTQRELELLLEQKYAQHYIEPYITAKITSKFIIYFPGDGGAVRKINIDAPRTTLLDIIAQNNGIGNQGRSDKIKIVRGDKKNPDIFLIDLSKMSNVQLSEIVIQAGDIIVVETRNDYLANFLQRISVYFIGINILFTIYFIASR